MGLLFLTTLTLGLLFSSCSGGGGEDTPMETDSGNNDATPAGIAPKVIWSVEHGVKNPVTDLAGCAESVMACVENGTVLKDCFGIEVSVCTGAEPTDGCCMQACGDQLTQKLDSGINEQDAFLEVFVYDGSCMPGIEEVTNQ